MNSKKLLRDLLLGEATITALVDQRIYWRRRPQSAALPAIVLHQVSRVPVYHHNGEAGLTSFRWQIDNWAESVDLAEAVSDAVRTFLGGYHGGAIGGTFVESEQDLGEETAENTLLECSSIDVTMHIEET